MIVVRTSWWSFLISMRMSERKLGVEVRKRLVEQEDLRIAYQRPAHRNALSLAAGELPGKAVEELLDAQDGGRPLHLRPDLLLGLALHLERERHVAIDVEVRIERIVLKHHGDVPVLRLDLVDDLPVDEDFAVADILQARDHAQQRALPAAGGTDQNEELGVEDIDVDAVDNLERSKALDDLLHADCGHCSSQQAFPTQKMRSDDDASCNRLQTSRPFVLRRDRG